MTVQSGPAPAMLVAAGLVATAAGGDVPVMFAAAAILGFGMLHGISDLALVPRQRRIGFLAAYLAIAAMTLALWRLAPVAALIVFLLASILHFAIEDAPATRPAERACRGLLMVGGPALLNRASVADLFTALGLAGEVATLLATFLTLAGLIGLLLLPIAWGERQRHPEGTTGEGWLIPPLASLILLPPPIGFAIGFTLLHASPELDERVAQRGSGTLARYIWHHRLIALGAGIVLALSGWLFAGHVPVPLALLFAGLAALALPHMIVTPLCRRRPGPSRAGWLAMVA